MKIYLDKKERRRLTTIKKIIDKIFSFMILIGILGWILIGSIADNVNGADFIIGVTLCFMTMIFGYLGKCWMGGRFNE